MILNIWQPTTKCQPYYTVACSLIPRPCTGKEFVSPHVAWNEATWPGMRLRGLGMWTALFPTWPGTRQPCSQAPPQLSHADSLTVNDIGAGRRLGAWERGYFWRGEIEDSSVTSSDIMSVRKSGRGRTFCCDCSANDGLRL